MDGFARWLLSAVTPEAERVPYVRRQAAAVLRLWRLDRVTAAVELLMDELAGNAVRHARTPFSVTLTWDGHTLRGEVTDVNPLPPPAETLAGAGRSRRTWAPARESTVRPLGIRRAQPRQDRVVRARPGDARRLARRARSWPVGGHGPQGRARRRTGTLGAEDGSPQFGSRGPGGAERHGSAPEACS
jgi:hypothetical protein